MIRFRSYRNSDPPAIAAIWRAQPPQRGLVPAVTPAILEDHVFSKLYFDRHGLILAEDDGQPIGFVHAGFGASDDLARLDSRRGATCLLLVSPRPDRTAIAAELLQRGESYLRTGGATELFGGGVFPNDPFYHGLYGGSEMPGVLASDTAACELFRAAGYTERERRLVLQLKLAGFRAPMNRTQLQLGRTNKIDVANDPPSANWWEACTLGHANRRRFSVTPKSGGAATGSVLMWDLEPLGSAWGARAVGLTQLAIAPDCRRKGLATWLVTESLRQLQTAGIQLVEAQVQASESGTLALFKKLGFQEVDQGVVFVKSA